MAGAEERLTLMAGRNGVALLPGAHRRLSLRSETITYELEDEGGEVVTLAGYKKGPGCPISILIAVDDALAELAENEPTDEERPTFTTNDDGTEITVPGTLPIRRYLAKAQTAERTLRREMLQAVIPGLTTAQANVIASDDGPWKDILVELGWRMPDDVPAEDAGEGEVVGLAASTGQPDSPDFVSPTPAETP